MSGLPIIIRPTEGNVLVTLALLVENRIAFVHVDSMVLYGAATFAGHDYLRRDQLPWNGSIRRFDEERSRFYFSRKRLQRATGSRRITFSLWSLPLSSFAANTNRHGWNSGECSSFCISPLSRIRSTFLCSGSTTFVNSGLSNGFWDKIENVRPNTFASNYWPIYCFGFGIFKFNLIRIPTLLRSN